MNKNSFLFKKYFLFWCTILFSLYASNANAQNVPVTLNLQNTKLVQVISAIEKQTSYLFVYDSNVDVQHEVSINVKAAPLKSVLNQLFDESNIAYSIEKESIILSKKQKAEVKSSGPRKITGVVKDSDGNLVIGASIIVKGQSNYGAATNIDGNFGFNIPADAKQLQVSYMGMKTQLVDVANRANFEIVLESSNVKMDEVVVTALGIKKEAKSLSYNVQQISANDNKTTDANFINSLGGKVAGVTINSSASGVGGASRVVMRGSKSISGNNNALYVIDGIPMANNSNGQVSDIYSGAGQSGDAVANINQDDIESYSVLSGPSAAALYGSAAANGVVLITTKKGQKDRLTVNVSNNTTFSSPLILPKFQNTYGQSEPNSYYSWGEKLSTPSSYKPSDFFQTGFNTANTISVSTGSEKNQTYVSAGSVNASGIIHNNDFSRYNFSVRNTSVMLNNKLTMDLGFMSSTIREQNMISQGLYFNPLVPLYLFPAGDDFSKVQIYKRYNADRNFQTQYWPYGDQGLTMQNPYWITEKDMFVNHKERYMTNASLKYEIAKWINISGRLKVDRSIEKYEKKLAASTNLLFASNTGYYSLNNVSGSQYYGEAMVNINKNLVGDQINITANIGTSFEDVQYAQNLYGGKLLSVPDLFSFGNIALNTSEVSQSGTHRMKQAVFASSQIGYKSMVYLDLTGRNDWASTVNSSFFYPTVGLSGIITDIFKCSNDVLNYLKLRISYSEVGNEPDNFLTVVTYKLPPRSLPETKTNKDNPTLKPERTSSWEAGANLVLFKNKLKVNATVYESSTYKQLFRSQFSSTGGFTFMYVNGGRIDNKGVELSASYNQDFGKLNWNSTLTYSLNRNKIKRLLRDFVNPETGVVSSSDKLVIGMNGCYQMVLNEGGSMGDIYVSSLKTDEHGAIYVHPSDQTVVADLKNFVYAGNTNPKYNAGWNNTFTWNGVSLNMLLTARVGGIVVSNTQAIMDAFGASKASADARDAGGALVNGKRIPAKEYYSIIGGGNDGGVGSMYCYSATNVRLAELTLGYDLPISRWCKPIKSLNVSFVGRNLFFIYNKAPFDPELTASTGTYYQGIDYFMMPSLRNLGFSVKLQF